MPRSRNGQRMGWAAGSPLDSSPGEKAQGSEFVPKWAQRLSLHHCVSPASDAPLEHPVSEEGTFLLLCELNRTRSKITGVQFITEIKEQPRSGARWGGGPGIHPCPPAPLTPTKPSRMALLPSRALQADGSLGGTHSESSAERGPARRRGPLLWVPGRHCLGSERRPTHMGNRERGPI